MPNYVEVLKINELDENKGTTVFVNERDIALYRYEGEFYALDNTCLHREGKLGDGTMQGPNVICPLHQWDYDVRTGVSRWNPKEAIAVYPVKVEGDAVMVDADAVSPKPRFKSEYLGLWTRREDPLEGEMHDIHAYSRGTKEFVEPMGSQRRSYPNFEQVYFLPGQLAHLPLLDDEPVETQIIIGEKRKQQLTLKAPIFVSHMSFGALSKEAKMALAKGTADFGTVMCSGEGGMLPEAQELASQYVFEMASGYFGWNEENIAKANGIEIKMGQSAKAGLGGLLPSKKVHGDIATVRGLPDGQEARSPARFTDINSVQDMAERIKWIRSVNPDIPIGIKFAASRIEADLAAACELDVDWITLDGRAGGTGAAGKHVKDNICVPTVFAIPRARKWLDEHGVTDVKLIVTGGFRTAPDVAKAIAMGADAIALATSVMMAIGCQQYRACSSNNCPVGIATQKTNLRERFEMEASAKRLVNFFEAWTEQMTDFARMCGKRSLHDLNYDDLATTSNEISSNTPITHV
ncbi:MAG: glutamate synthase-related protein [Anaerolineae bacterium]|nr:glutamate synthase-related protein [Anaerolineae bacterium]MDQ7035854.1 glutamate synthase-related protein [Anaerolineae bacterium]